MFTAHRACIALGMAAAVAACSHAVVEMPDYRGASVERVKELPDVTAASMAGSVGNRFPGACAQTLRVARDGQELQLMKAKTTTAEAQEHDTTTTRLVSAVGEYAVVTREPSKSAPLPRLQVDCLSGKATGWVGE